MHFIKMITARVGSWVLLAILICAGCSPTQNGPAKSVGSEASKNESPNKPLRVVATYSILGDFVQKIGGDNITLTVLVGPQGDAHTYEPTPKDSLALAQADIIFENGLGFEVWLEQLVQTSESKARRVVVTEKINPRQLVISSTVTEIDPHVWHLPENAKQMVNSITAALAEADPQQTQVYRQRQASYLGELQELNQWIAAQVSLIPEPRRKLVTTHDTFGYFADSFGFEVLSVLGSVSSESSDPSAGQVAEVIERIREYKVPAIFAENILNAKLTAMIAEEAGVKVVPTLYTDALGPLDSPGKDYLGMMRYNVQTMVEALR